MERAFDDSVASHARDPLAERRVRSGDLEEPRQSRVAPPDARTAPREQDLPLRLSEELPQSGDAAVDVRHGGERPAQNVRRGALVLSQLDPELASDGGRRIHSP